MKRYFLIITAIFAICQICNSQTPINNPLVYVTENGSNIGNGVGGYFLNPISAHCFVQNVYNGVYSGEITVKFAGGDYYYDFYFFNIPTNIRCIKMYGGCDPYAPFNMRDLDDRDFYHNETRFHATGNDDIMNMSSIGANHPSGAVTSIIDGITFIGDGHNISNSALVLNNGDYVIAQCKFEKFVTTKWLIWMETAGHTVTYTSCLFRGNEARNLMALCTNVNLINVTIADNYFTDDMFVPYSTNYQHYIYNLQNSIIYNNNNMHMAYDSFDVSNSILEYYESWVNNIANNMIGSTYDPIFNSYSSEPYSCDYYSSPAIAAGSASFIYFSSFYDPNIMDYDVVNMYRYYDFYALKTDMGAYQNGYEDGTHLYNTMGPIVSAPKRHSDASTGSGIPVIGANDIQNGAILTLYDVSGKIIYTTSAKNDLKANTLNSGIYVAIVTSKDGQEISSKKIVIP